MAFASGLDLITKRSIAVFEPAQADRQWVLSAKSPIIGVTSIVAGRFKCMPPSASKINWFFDESDANLLTTSTWETIRHNLDVQNPINTLVWFDTFREPVYIQIPGAVMRHGFPLLGVIASAASIKTVVDGKLAGTAPFPHPVWVTPAARHVHRMLMIRDHGAQQSFKVTIYSDKSKECECVWWVSHKDCDHIIDGRVAEVIRQMP